MVVVVVGGGGVRDRVEMNSSTAGFNSIAEQSHRDSVRKAVAQQQVSTALRNKVTETVSEKP